MTALRISELQLIVFVLVDSAGDEVMGLGAAFTIFVSKMGGAFAAGTGIKTEIGAGWYTYELTADETDTAGPLAVKITGVGVVQQNLLYQVSGSAWAVPSGTYILTATEAANVLRCLNTDADMLALLPLVDAYIEQATGRNWAGDTSIDPLAKSAARILVTLWHENPAMIASGMGALPWGLTACLVQLEAKALELETSGLPEEALKLLASVPPDGYDGLAVGANLVLQFNHEMAAGATSAVLLKNSSGSTVTSTITLDVTSKIMTINPGSNLSPVSHYIIDIDHAADIYGLTLDQELSFRTA